MIMVGDLYIEIFKYRLPYMPIYYVYISINVYVYRHISGHFYYEIFLETTRPCDVIQHHNFVK